jgi:hypothetical protein
MKCALCGVEVAPESAIEGAFCVRCAAHLPPPKTEMEAPAPVAPPPEAPPESKSHEGTSLASFGIFDDDDHPKKKKGK